MYRLDSVLQNPCPSCGSGQGIKHDPSCPERILRGLTTPFGIAPVRVQFQAAGRSGRRGTLVAIVREDEYHQRCLIIEEGHGLVETPGWCIQRVLLPGEEA